MVTICTRLRQEPQVRALAERYDGVFYAAGTHPMQAAEEPLATVDELVALSTHPKFVGIGETGLDYHYTADSAAMNAVLEVLGERRLYFLDSRTSAESVGYELARESGVAAARRDLFLDEVRAAFGASRRSATARSPRSTAVELSVRTRVP